MAKKHRTPAYETFLENMREVRRLLQIHKELGGGGPGRRWGSEVLNKSAVVLLVACWEAYLEDVASFAFDTSLGKCRKPRHFPKEVIKRIGESVRANKDERAVWNLAGDGWRSVLSDYKKRVIEKFHNPNSGSIDDFFLRLLGMKAFSQCWHWAGMSSERAKTKLDNVVFVRGSLAHRMRHSAPIHLTRVRDYQGHIRKLVRRTDREMFAFLKKP
jgi:hypothetical protein